ncbi:hypothetical protein M8494_00255 [Serratia ureilytica]
MIVQRWSEVPGKRRWRRVALAMVVLAALLGWLSLLNRPLTRNHRKRRASSAGTSKKRVGDRDSETASAGERGRAGQRAVEKLYVKQGDRVIQAAVGRDDPTLQLTSCASHRLNYAARRRRNWRARHS